jgi:hypothetical protein
LQSRGPRAFPRGPQYLFGKVATLGGPPSSEGRHRGTVTASRRALAVNSKFLA